MQLQVDVNVEDERKQALDAWVSARLQTRVVGEPASADASFRRYFRYAHGGKTYIAMDAPPAHENCEPFIRIAGVMAAGGVPVPAILAEERELGFLLLSDLGRDTWLGTITPANADAWFELAIATLVRIQQLPVTGLPHYDQPLIARELALFPDWYLAQERRLTLTPAQQQDWELLCTRLAQVMLEQPQVFVHRDFMPRNLMVSTPNPGVLDFQDAVAGPIAYDPVCLFRDAFLSWPEADITRWLTQYHRAGLAAGLPLPVDFSVFKRWADFTGVQRHLKVIGIFARICHRDGKPKYLADVPRFFRYLQTQAAAYAELAPLARLLQELAP